MEVTDGGPHDSSLEGGDRDEVEVLAAEFLARRRQGENPSIQEYADRRPDLAPAIHELFPTLLLVEELGGHSTGDAMAQAEVGVTGDLTGGLRQVGEYCILREIGRGGMGIVYEAKQESLGRRVALKILPFHSLLGPKHLERFQQEARAAARLSHPNIVSVFGVGEHLGLHYFAMQYIPGQGLDRVIEEVRRLRDGGTSTADSGIATQLSSRGGRERYHQNAARIARDAALALDHAHREGVLHRDVKPSNLLLDPTGHVWLADFGLAKSTDSDQLTGTGDFIGTFRYMAPERFKGWSDPRSDVYALGLTLYELLALRPAYAERDRERLLRKLASEDPSPLRRIDRSIPGDLETIVFKACAKEPSQRYSTAQAMAEDLDRYLRGEPVTARRSTPLGRLRRWCARNPALAALAAVALFLLVMVAVVSSTAAVKLAHERKAGDEKLWSSYLAQARALRFSGRPGQRFGAIDALAEAVKLRAGPELRDEAAACVALDDARVLRSWTRENDVLPYFDVDLDRVALAGKNGEIVVRSLDDGREIASLPGPGFPILYICARFHPDGRHLAVRHHKEGLDRWTVWDLERKKVAATVEDGMSNDGIDFDRRDGSVVVPTRRNTLRALDPISGRVVSERAFRFKMGELAVHPGGQLVAITPHSEGTGLYIADRTSGQVLRTLNHEAVPNGVAWHPGGRHVASGCFDFKVYLWDAETGDLLWSVPGHEAETFEVRFRPDGGMLMSAGWEDRLRFWDTWTGRSLFVLPGRTGNFSVDGRFLAIYGLSSYEKLELSPARDVFTLHGHLQRGAKHPYGVALAPDGRLAATCGDDGVRLWDLSARREIAHLAVGRSNFVDFDASGAHLYGGGRSGLFRWPIRSSSASGMTRIAVGPVEGAGLLPNIRCASSGDGGSTVAFVQGDGAAYWTHLHKPDALQALEAVPVLDSIAMSPGGQWIAGGSRTLKQTVLWSSSDGKLAKKLEAPSGVLRFDPLGRYLVVVTAAEYLFLDTRDWTTIRRITRSSSLPVPGLIAFDRGGSVMAIATNDFQISLIEVESGRRLAELEAPDRGILNGLALDVKNGLLAASSITQRFHVWDLRGIERQLAAIGLTWDLRLPAKEGEAPQPLMVDVLTQGSHVGRIPEIDDPRELPMLDRHRRALFRPRLESYGDVDTALAAPRFLVFPGAVWSFHRGRSEPSPGLEWTRLNFDDTSWESGPSGFNGRRVTSAENPTSLLDQLNSYTTLYVRHVFEIDNLEQIEKIFLALSFEDGFVAYLNHTEVARSNVGQPGDRPACSDLATRVTELVRQDAVYSFDPSLLVPGKNVLAIQVLTYSRDSYVFLLPALAAALSPDEIRDRSRLEGIMKGNDGAPVPALEAYGEGMVLQRAGKIEDALSAFKRAASLDPHAPEPILRSLECLRLLKQHEAAELLARENLVQGKLIDDEEVWIGWLLAMCGALQRSPREALAAWPETPPDSARRHGAALRTVVEQLAGEGVVRIRCGAGAWSDTSGKTWSADAFFLSGVAVPAVASQGEAPVIEGAEDPALYRAHRRFPGARCLKPAYRVPLIPGRYRVSLHFAELSLRPSNTRLLGKLLGQRVLYDKNERIFSIVLERRVVCESYEPAKRGFAAADVQKFELDVTDGYLDIDFLAERAEPILSAIEIERLNG